MSYVGALDQGTSSTRFMLFDKKGNVAAKAQREFDLINPKPGAAWVEQNPEVLLSTSLQCIQQCMNSIEAKQVVAFGITNQRETTILWDKITGKPLHNAVVWLDSRTESICDRLIKRFGSKDYFRSTTGLPISTYFSATKIMWLMENVPEVQKAIREERCLFGTVDTWLIWSLTGGPRGGQHVTDITNASRTNLLDLHTKTWSSAICDELGIPMSILPAIRSSSEVYGKCAVGELKGVPIAGCVGDQQAAMVGQQCFRPGNVKNTYGTGCFMLMNTGEKIINSRNGLLTTALYQLGKDAPVTYALEGSVEVAGAGVKWLCDKLGLKDGEELSRLAATVPDTAGVYFVPAFTGLYAPHWRSDAKGMICGLTFSSTRAHIARSVLEAICFRSQEVISAMQKDSGMQLSSLKVDGGASRSDVMMSFQASIIGIEVARPHMDETTALGAAITAALAVGFYKSLEDVSDSLTVEMKMFEPRMTEATRNKQLRIWQNVIQRAFKSHFDQDAEENSEIKSKL